MDEWQTAGVGVGRSAAAARRHHLRGRYHGPRRCDTVGDTCVAEAVIDGEVRGRDTLSRWTDVTPWGRPRGMLGPVERLPNAASAAEEVTTLLLDYSIYTGIRYWPACLHSLSFLSLPSIALTAAVSLPRHRSLFQDAYPDPCE